MEDMSQEQISSLLFKHPVILNVLTAVFSIPQTKINLKKGNKKHDRIYSKVLVSLEYAHCIK